MTADDKTFVDPSAASEDGGDKPSGTVVDMQTVRSGGGGVAGLAANPTARSENDKSVVQGGEGGGDGGTSPPSPRHQPPKEEAVAGRFIIHPADSWGINIEPDDLPSPIPEEQSEVLHLFYTSWGILKL